MTKWGLRRVGQSANETAVRPETAVPLKWRTHSVQCIGIRSSTHTFRSEYRRPLIHPHIHSFIIFTTLVLFNALISSHFMFSLPRLIRPIHSIDSFIGFIPPTYYPASFPSRFHQLIPLIQSAGWIPWTNSNYSFHPIHSTNSLHRFIPPIHSTDQFHHFVPPIQSTK